ncbi:mycofactocin system GMC family oxidoreductase MftG [Microbacterium sp. Marseille-Q6965]|uniref:mycofactocin dehydrogenase MftG n=1 Tax=Microbacterium sp. Marseille-Q6965 TaxID=2965072 RepID=UPI0021B84287|nr:mycofactocin system GMC family oxidoreductase MftG [Microbacterium sp. Marseille-Q6965]
MTRGAGWDVVVVGGGSAGSALAARLSEDPDRRVLLLEAGPAPRRAADFPAVIRDGTTVAAAAPGNAAAWTYRTELIPGRAYDLVRGRILGGSSAINGGYFVRPRATDLERWAAAGGPPWSYAAALPVLRAMETDLDYGATDVHGGDGPTPVRRAGADHPVARAFIEAALAAGHPLEADKNAPGTPGVGPVPQNVVAGVRRNAAMQYLLPALRRPNLDVRGGAVARRIRFDGTRARGVELAGEEVLYGDEVVLCAGSVATPHLLLLSGIGPADELRRHGIPVVADLPGVGRDFTDHPNVTLTWHARPGVVARRPLDGSPFATALNWRARGAASGDLELLVGLRRFDELLPGLGMPHRLPVILGWQAEGSRGRLTLVPDPTAPPLLEHHYLSSADDRALARHGVRAAAGLLARREFAPVFAGLTDVAADVLQDDRALDAWVRSHLGTAIHLCGSARMGPASDPGAVTDGAGRVHGTERLRLADTSILPVTPTRGPAASAILVGEIIARGMRGTA